MSFFRDTDEPDGEFYRACLKGDTATGGTKPATLSTGFTVKGVPLFVNIGDVLRIDTRTGEYVSRIKG